VAEFADTQKSQDQAVFKSFAEQTLEGAAWEEEIQQSTPLCSDELPEEMPLGCSRILHMVAVLNPRGNVVSRFLHHRFIWICIVWTFMYSIITAVCAHKNVVHVLVGVSAATLAGGMVLPGWFVWSHQFSKHGHTMSMLHRMSKRQFPWTRMKWNVRCFWTIAPTVTVLGLLRDIANLAALRHEYDSVDFFESAFRFMGDSMASHMTSVVILLGHISSNVTIFLFLSQIWICQLAGHLHCHNLRCYAGAVDKALELDLDKEEVVTALSHVELAVSGDFVRASNTWVTLALYQMSIVSLFMLTSVALLLRGIAVGELGALTLNILMVILCVLVLLNLAWPLARVKTVFEIDIQLALNNPLVMHRAQKYFTSQFLAHLKHLEWGFRFGGNTLGAASFTRIGSSIFIALCIAVSNIAFKLVSSVG